MCVSVRVCASCVRHVYVMCVSVRVMCASCVRHVTLASGPKLNANAMYDGAKIDIWAAGVVLFIMYTGAPPLGEAIKGDWYFDRMRKKQVRDVD